MPLLLAGALVVALVMLVLLVAPVVAGASLLSRLARKRATPAEPGREGFLRAKPTAMERLVRRPLSTGALIAWLVVPLAVIGLWVTADVLTERPGGRVPTLAGSAGRGLSQALLQPTMSSALLVGVWTNSAAAKMEFAANGHFTETGLPGPPPGDRSMAGLTVPRSAAGTWELYGSSAGYQLVRLMFASGVQLDLSVRRQSFGRHGASYLVLQMYRGAGELAPRYRLTWRGVGTYSATSPNG